MCGIVGVLAAEPFAERDLAPALDALGHRGPDDRATWIDRRVGLALGHTRLAILDLSATGAQPMVSASGDLVLVYNGEVYNHRELRSRLEGAGRSFRGTSDTEVLLEALDAWGPAAALSRIDGMFAFALWDRRRRRLTLGRDRLGEKPLYFGRLPGARGPAFAFASELAALRTLRGFEGEIDRGALTLFLRHKYVPAPHTIYRGIHKLPPATTLTVTEPATIPRPEPYWSLFDLLAASDGTSRARRDPTEAADELEAALDRVVAERLVADVPVGAFLSGGVDSSLVTSAMVRTGTTVRTFTVGFAESEYDESGHARAVAEHLGTNHTELLVSPRMALDVVPRLASIYDEPFADSSQIPTFLVSRLAREHVKVALSGDGGDELFGGYNRYLWAHRMLARSARVPAPLRRAASRLALAVPVTAWDRLGALMPARYRQPQTGLKVHKAAVALGAEDASSLLRRLTTHWTEPDSLVIGATEPPSPLAGLRPPIADPAGYMMALDAVTYLPDDILVKLDRAAMAVGLETRAPLLALPIVELAARLPLELKIRGGETKWLLRTVLDRTVPRSLIDRPKAGFGVPLDCWLRGPLRGWARERLDPALLERDGYLSSEPIERVWRRHQSGLENGAYKLWDVLMFQSWLHDADREGARRCETRSAS